MIPLSNAKSVSFCHHFFAELHIIKQQAVDLQQYKLSVMMINSVKISSDFLTSIVDRSYAVSNAKQAV
jgi:hypothetical protein